jgi:hypothetical protein
LPQTQNDAAETPANVDADAPADVVPDAPPDIASDLPDAAPDADAPPPCDPSQRFGAPVLVTGIHAAGGNDVTPRLSRDELTLYFANDQTSAGAFKLFMATRPRFGADFGAPALIPGLNSKDGSSLNPTVTEDGLTMYLESTRATEPIIYLTSRAELTAHWSDPLVYLGAGDSGPDVMVGDRAPYVLPAGNVLYFQSTRTGNADIFRADIATVTVADVRGVNSAYDELRPVVTEDELTIYFASSRPDPAAQGGWDIWVATRGSRDADFGAPTVVRELSTEESESPGWISPDGCRLYFDRGGSTTLSRVYVAQKP